MSALQRAMVFISTTGPVRGGRQAAARGQQRDKRLRYGIVDNNALGGHADLPGVGEGAKTAPAAACSISASSSTSRRFSTELEHRWFQILSAGAGDNAPHRCGAGKVNAPHRRVGDQRFHQRRRIFRRTGKIVHHARRKPAASRASIISP